MSKTQRASLISIVGRIVFGLLSGMGLVMALKGRFGQPESDGAMVAGAQVFMISFTMFLLTFVRRFF